MFLNQEIKDDFKCLIKEFMDDADHIYFSRVKQALYCNLVRLAQDLNINICSLNNENGLAIFSAQDHYNKLDIIIHDKSKFEEIDQD